MLTRIVARRIFLGLKKLGRVKHNKCVLLSLLFCNTVGFVANKAELINVYRATTPLLSYNCNWRQSVSGSKDSAS